MEGSENHPMGGGTQQRKNERRKWLWRQRWRWRKPEKYSRRWRQHREPRPSLFSYKAYPLQIL